MTQAFEDQDTVAIPERQRPLERAAQYLDEIAQEMPTKRDIKRQERRRKRTATVTVALVALIAVVGLVLGGWNTRKIGQVAASDAINAGSIEALQQARDELRASGVPEAQLPAPIVIREGEPVDVDALVAATTATIIAKIRTDPNFRGASGIDGLNGIDGATPPCLFLPNMCKGDPGEKGDPGDKGDQGDQGIPGINGTNGTNGTDGVNGTNGADSTVPGPPGETCPPGTSLGPIDVVTESATVTTPQVKTRIIACI
jgi:hypothetical protein